MSKVILVGAGPGDPGLLTIRGWNALAKADVILYDNLVNPEILRWARTDAKRLYVGKDTAGQRRRQAAIHRILLREARTVRLVVRLKGGDPYLFGRGAEEGIFLKKHRIPFEVIPGVTSAIGCAATAGIPLTERHLSSSVSFATGHEAGDKKSRLVDWKSLSASGTVAIYMGVSRIAAVAAKLVQSGVPLSRPAAIVQWGTWNRQRSCVGTVGDIARKVEQAGIGAPAMLFVGDVVRLRASLDWFEKRPLFGKTVVVTRALSQSANLRRALEDEGAIVVEIPAIEILPPRSFGPMDGAIERLGSFDWIVFTSTNGVDYFFDRLNSKGGDARALARARIAAVGSATEKELLRYGVRADFVPSAFSTDDLVRELVRSSDPRGLKFLLLRSHIAPPNLAVKLKRAGARVSEVAAYRTLSSRSRVRSHIRALRSEPDAVCFTSASTTDGFFGALPKPEIRRRLGRARIVSIGPVTSGAVRRRGFRVHAEADPYTAEGLTAAVIRAIGRKKTR